MAGYKTGKGSSSSGVTIKEKTRAQVDLISPSAGSIAYDFSDGFVGEVWSCITPGVWIKHAPISLAGGRSFPLDIAVRSNYQTAFAAFSYFNGWDEVNFIHFHRVGADGETSATNYQMTITLLGSGNRIDTFWEAGGGADRALSFDTPDDGMGSPIVVDNQPHTIALVVLNGTIWCFLDGALCPAKSVSAGPFTNATTHFTHSSAYPTGGSSTGPLDITQLSGGSLTSKRDFLIKVGLPSEDETSVTSFVKKIIGADELRTS